MSSSDNFAKQPVDGIFIVSALPSDAKHIENLIRSMRAGVGLQHDAVLAEFNRNLIRVATDDELSSPLSIATHHEYLNPYLDEARNKFMRALGDHPLRGGKHPWIWSDPNNCFLLSFWIHTLGINPAVVVSFPDPISFEHLKAGETGLPPATWNPFYRSALAICYGHPALLVDRESLQQKSEAAINKLATFFDTCDIPFDSRFKVAESAHLADRQIDSGPVIEVAPADKGLLSILTALDHETGSYIDENHVAKLLGAFYDEDYYQEYDEFPYRRDVPVWKNYFGAVAEQIKTTITPKKVLDAGCAIGILVEELRNRGIDASGIDISAYAIGQAPEDLRPFLSVGSFDVEIDGDFDLIVCTEVIEHMTPTQASYAIANFCRHTNAVLFSSTPDDFDDPTHVNVHPISDWALEFAKQGFFRDFDYDAGYIAPQAVLFRRGELTRDQLIEGYEGRQWRSSTESTARFNAVNDEKAASIATVVELNMRREAESRAALDAVSLHDNAHLALVRLLEEAQLESLNANRLVASIEDTKIFRYSAGLRRLYGRMRALRPEKEPTSIPAVTLSPVKSGSDYGTWVELYDQLDEPTRTHILQRCESLENPPLISVVIPVYNAPEKYLRAAVDSVKQQIYTNWELCLADDNSSDPVVANVLGEIEDSDRRIRIVRRQENGHISAASNSALSIARGQWVAFLDHDDVLAEHALALVALSIAENPTAGMIYSDEDEIDDQDRRHTPYFKPDFDSLLLLGQNYPSHLSAIRRDLIERVGGFRLGYEGSQDWDLILRISELLQPYQIVHVPHVLYHWRVHPGSTAESLVAKPYAAKAGQSAVQDHLVRTGRRGLVMRVPATGWNRVKWSLPGVPPKVSIVIPTRDGKFLSRCVDSVLGLTTYPDYEVIVIDNGSESFACLEYLRSREHATTVLRDSGPFNYSQLNNDAIKTATGDVVCLLNDDTEILQGDWLDELVGQVLQPGVGIAGAKLYYPSGLVQHAGVVLGIKGVAAHVHRMDDRLDPGYFGRSHLAQCMSAVTGACMVVRREVWEELGGLDAKNLSIAFNDIDLCLRAHEGGWRVVWTPFAELLHHESISRGSDFDGPRAAEFQREVRYMKDRWGELLRTDPAYNPNLTLTDEDFSLAWPPRVSYRAQSQDC
jgi:glycosyltransferase involved in cell wall biosynthesis